MFNSSILPDTGSLATDENLIAMASYARSNPEARLRLLVAIYDTTNLINALASSLIADELLLGEEAPDEEPTPEQSLTEPPHLTEAQA